jgi:hypothetical protein
MIYDPKTGKQHYAHASPLGLSLFGQCDIFTFPPDVKIELDFPSGYIWPQDPQKPRPQVVY